jgi:ribosome biogenesis GTPase
VSFEVKDPAEQSHQQFHLAQLGWDKTRQAEVDQIATPDLHPGRIGVAVRGRYQVLGLAGTSAQWASCRKSVIPSDAGLSPFPAVGDWALVRRDRDTVVIERLLIRRSFFVRKTAGRVTQPQVIAANVDRVLIVTAVDRDFNLRRIERYLATVWAGGAEPVIVMNKTDLSHDRVRLVGELENVAPGVRVIMCSAQDDHDLSQVVALCELGMTVALVGSSGVGKSTIINRLAGAERQATNPVRARDHRGRHTTARQELMVMPSGAILIDTAGLRELGLWEAEEGVGRTFADIEGMAQRCRFRDCRHTGEPGCAVETAIRNGSLDQERLDGYLRLQREMEHTKLRADARASSGSKKRWKEIAKSARQLYRLRKDLGMKEK